MYPACNHSFSQNPPLPREHSMDYAMILLLCCRIYFNHWFFLFSPRPISITMAFISHAQDVPKHHSIFMSLALEAVSLATPVTARTRAVNWIRRHPSTQTINGGGLRHCWFHDSSLPAAANVLVAVRNQIISDLISPLAPPGVRSASNDASSDQRARWIRLCCQIIWAWILHSLRFSRSMAGISNLYISC